MCTCWRNRTWRVMRRANRALPKRASCNHRVVQQKPAISKEKSMPQTRQLTGLIKREGDGYVALCPELDVASEGDTVEEARSNLEEALELFFEVASAEE